MAAPVISISSDSSDESVGSSSLWVILIGSIHIKVPVASEVAAAAIASPARVLELDTHSSSESGPTEGSQPPVPVSPMVLPFLHSDDSESDTALLERHVSSLSHDSMDIPAGRLYRTHLGGPCRALTAKNSVRPLLSHHLASRYTSHHLDHFTSGSSSDHSLSDHSSLDHSSSGHSTSEHSSSRHSTSDHFSSGHTPPVTTITDLSTQSIFIYTPLARTSRYIKAYRCWRSAPLCTMYPPTTSESSARDSSFESSIGPSRKRYRYSISSEDSTKEEIDADVLADIEADIATAETVVGIDVEAGIDAGI
ncbi:hypothetical protein Tco_1190646, partial [Tanacetum coccineum]